MEIINAGVPGNNTREILARLEKDCLALRPSLVILKAGSNDTLNSFHFVPFAETVRNLRAIAAQVLACGAKMLLCTMLTYQEEYLLERHGGLGAYGDLPPALRFQQVLEAIREMSGEMKLPLADLNQIFLAHGEPKMSPDSLLRNAANCGVKDGVHPSPAGYVVMAEEIARVIRDNSLPTAKIVCMGDSITFGQYVQGEGTATGETYPGVLARLLANQA